MYYLAADSSLTVGKALSKGLKKFFPFLGTAILTGLTTVAGYALMIIPGLLFSVWFSLTMPVLLFEGQAGTKAMARSREYVRGRFWAVVWRLIVIGFFAGILTSLANFITVHVNSPVGKSLSAIFGILILPLSSIYLVELYAHLRTTYVHVERKHTALKTWIWIFAILGILIPVALVYLFLLAGSRM